LRGAEEVLTGEAERDLCLGREEEGGESGMVELGEGQLGYCPPLVTSSRRLNFVNKDGCPAINFSRARHAHRIRQLCTAALRRQISALRAHQLHSQSRGPTSPLGWWFSSAVTRSLSTMK
jgi:hypothetical protein